MDYIENHRVQRLLGGGGKQELVDLLSDVDNFIAKIFDFATPLNKVDFLHSAMEFRNHVQKLAEMDIYYTVEYDGEQWDMECETREQAEAKVDQWFADKFLDETMKNGEVREDEAFIIEFTYSDDSEKIILSRDKYNLYYEYYHGDKVEHGTY